MSHSAFLKNHKAASLLTQRGVVQTISSTDTVQAGLDKLTKLGFLSLPIINPAAKTSGGPPFLGFLSVYDIMNHVCFAPIHKGHEESKEVGKDSMQKALKMEILDMDVGSFFKMVQEASVFSPLPWCMEASVTMDRVASAFSAGRGMHRVLLKDEKGYCMLSQSDIIRLICQKAEEEKDVDDSELISFLGEPLKKLGISGHTVFTIEESKAAIEGFRLISKKHVNAIAVVNKEGKLVNTLSASDLRGLNAKNLESTLASCTQFLKDKTKGAQITTNPEEALLHAVSKLAVNKVHRLWVVDAQGKPTGVVTLTDIIHAFATNVAAGDKSSLAAAAAAAAQEQKS